MRVTIIEDEEILLDILKEKFSREHFEVSVARDGEEAVPVISEAKPDVILLDLVLPQKSGFQVLEELKADSELKRIPVMVLTNLGQEEEMRRALQLGAEDFIIKTQYPLNVIVEKVKNKIKKI